MTVKTAKPATNESIKSSNITQSDMQSKKRGAARNLFGTTVDREELSQQLRTQERDSMRELGNYKFNKNSVISVINRDDEDQRRKLKYLPPRETHSTRNSARNTSLTLQSMILDQGASSSTSSSSYKSAESKANSTQKTINHTLPKGQRTIKDYYPIVKRRSNR